MTVETEDLKKFFEERAGILEFDAGLPRPDAELEAARITATYAGNRGYLWASLPAALADHPLLLAQLPDRASPVDALSLVAVRRAHPSFEPFATAQLVSTLAAVAEIPARTSEKPVSTALPE